MSIIFMYFPPQIFIHAVQEIIGISIPEWTATQVTGTIKKFM